MVTIADVAARAGVGAGTVSRVLNDSPKVSADHPGPRARRHRGARLPAQPPGPGPRRSGGARPSASSSRSSPTRRRSSACAAWSPRCDDSRYDLVLFNVESPVHRDEHFAALTGRDRADGLLIMSLPLPPASLDAAARTPACPIVLVDAAGAGVPCGRHRRRRGRPHRHPPPLDLGHARIAFMGDTPDNSFGFTVERQRQQGYEEVAARRGHPGPARATSRHGPHERDVARRLAEQLLDLRDAADRDLRLLRRAGHRCARGGSGRAASACPSDLSVVGFDDIEIVRLRRPHHRAPAAVRQRLARRPAPARRRSRRASTLVAAEHHLPLELVERSTTGPAERKETTAMADIVLEDVWKVYPDGTEAVRALDLDIADGEFMVLVGPSGCGKTTALRMVAGLEAISQGHGPHRRPRRERRAAEGPRHRHGVPELRAVPAHERVRQHGVRAQAAEGAEGRDRPAGARRGPHPRPRRAARPQAQGALGRPAPAGRHGPGHRPPPAGVPDGRAAVEPRRQAARADPRRDRPAPARPRRHHDLRHPRPGRGHDDGRPRRGHAQGRAAAGRHARRRSTSTRSTSSSPASSARRP